MLSKLGAQIKFVFQNINSSGQLKRLCLQSAQLKEITRIIVEFIAYNASLQASSAQITKYLFLQRNFDGVVAVLRQVLDSNENKHSIRFDWITASAANSQLILSILTLLISSSFEWDIKKLLYSLVLHKKFFDTSLGCNATLISQQ